MDGISFNLYERVRLPGRREGFIIGMSFSPDRLTVLTDDYMEVECWSWQATKARRTPGQTVKHKDPAGGMNGSFYPVELENSARLRMAIWHDHWDRFPPGGDGPSYYESYWKEYRGGNKAPLPARQDIRGQTPAPPEKPQQLSMF